MTIEVADRTPIGLAVYEILREARANEKLECRDTVRYSFFRPVVVHVGSFSFSAFSREVSEIGIGLLHNVDLPQGPVDVCIPTDQEYSVRIRTDILWCSPIVEGWYISGGKFIDIAGIRTNDATA